MTFPTTSVHEDKGVVHGVEHDKATKEFDKHVQEKIC
jgi:hypothetical protein